MDILPPKSKINSFVLTCATIHASKLFWCGASRFGGISLEHVTVYTLQSILQIIPVL